MVRPWPGAPRRHRPLPRWRLWNGRALFRRRPGTHAALLVASAPCYLGDRRWYPTGIGRVHVCSWWDDLVDSVEDALFEDEVPGRQLIDQLLHRPWTDDRCGYRRVLDDKGQCQVHQGGPCVRGQLEQLLDEVELALVVRIGRVETLRHQGG